MTTSIDITNRAIAQIGGRAQITSFTDGSAEGLYAGLLYAPLRDFMLREGDYDFSILTAVLTASGASGPPWVFSYSYPSTAIRIRSLIPLIYVALDPVPIEYNVVGGGSMKFILTKEPAGSAIFTIAPIEDIWDSMFTEAFTRLLASALAFALENRIEASKEKLSEALNFAGIANLRDS